MISEVMFLASLMGIFVALFFRELVRRKDLELETHKLIREARTDAVKRSRASIEGQVFQQLVTRFPEWGYTPSDARFIASPLDFVVFDGLSKGKVEKVIFVEVKSRRSKETSRQRSVRNAIREGKVSYELLEIKE